MVVQTIGAFLAVLSFALILEVPARHILRAGFVGAVCWAIYLISLRYSDSVIASAFVSTLVVAFISHIFARRFKGARYGVSCGRNPPIRAGRLDLPQCVLHDTECK